MKNKQGKLCANIAGSFLTFASALLILVSVGSASAGDILFEAKLSEKDHFSSSGKRLTTVAAIIRQDRANYYKFGKRDAGDTGFDGGFYQSAASRAGLERDIEKMKLSLALRKKIINGTPQIYVGLDDDNTLVIGVKDW